MYAFENSRYDGKLLYELSFQELGNCCTGYYRGFIGREIK